jgi:creatinine amidohydrolase
MPRNWDKVSKDTGIGNPKKSTAAKGERYVKAVVDKITTLLVDLMSER